MVDALAKDIKAKIFTGPLDLGMFQNTKINWFMAVHKASGDRRQVGNPSSPEGMSFDEGIPPEMLKAWPVKQTTAKQFSIKITRAGQNATLSKCDMVAA